MERLFELEKQIKESCDVDVEAWKHNDVAIGYLVITAGHLSYEQLKVVESRVKYLTGIFVSGGQLIIGIIV